MTAPTANSAIGNLCIEISDGLIKREVDVTTGGNKISTAPTVIPSVGVKR